MPKRRAYALIGGVGLLLTVRLAAAQAAPDAPPAFGPKVMVPLPERDKTPLTVLEPVRGGLTAADVARRALGNSATVRARQAELAAAEARIEQTTVQFFPRLTLRASYTRLSPVSSGLGEGMLVGARNAGPLATGPCPSGVGVCVLDSGGVPVVAAPFELPVLENSYVLTASVTVPLSDYVTRLSHAAAAAKGSRRSADLSVRAERLAVETEARALYYNWVRARGQVAVAHKSLETTRARQKDATSAYTLGTISKADLMRLEALVASTELAVKEAETVQALTERQLRILMGDRASVNFVVGEGVLAPVSTPVQGSLDGLTAEALSRRLEVRALEESERSLRAGASAARGAALPRVDAFGDVTYANPNPRHFPQQSEWNATWAVGVSATWTISETFSSSAAARELTANSQALAARREALRDGIRREVAAGYLDRERANVAISTSERAATAAEEAYRVATDLYRVGRATTTELIAAEADLLNARLTELNARVGQRIAEVRLWHAVGRDVPAAIQ